MLLSDAVPLKSPFRRYVDLWGLSPDGMPVLTRSSHLLPVLRDGKPAMLKIARHAEERAGNALMRWWGGEGAVRVFACEGDAILMERAAGDRSLAAMARGGMDSEAVEIICSVARKLHADRAEPPPPLTPLARWFEPLEPAALQLGGVLRQSLETAGELLNAPVDSVVLHGDLHHGNVLDGGPRGWLAIDPKGLSGERAFDFMRVLLHVAGGDRHGFIVDLRIAAVVGAQRHGDEADQENREQDKENDVAGLGIPGLRGLSLHVAKPAGSS